MCKRIVRITGLIAIVHALAGVLVGLVFLFVVPVVDYSTHTMISTLSAEQSKPVAEQVHKLSALMNTPMFDGFFYSISVIVLLFNGILAYLGTRLFIQDWRAMLPFIGLMLFYAFMIYGVVRFIPKAILYFSSASSLQESEPAVVFILAFRAASVGLVLLSASYFWLWGPSLLVLAMWYHHVRRSRHE